MTLLNPSVVLNKIDEIVIEDRPVPKIEDPHYVKIAIKKTGICGSDVHYYVHGCCGSFVVTAPMVLGHESAGEVVEVGSAVKTLKVGDRVACEPGIPSRYSAEYKSGNYNLDPDMAFAATPPYDGTLCRYYLLPEDYCVKLPDHVTLEEGALVEPLSVGVHSCRLADVKFGDKLVVFGAGPVGLLVAAVGKAFGATDVLIVDIVEDKLQFAKKLGVATHIYNSSGDRGKSLTETKELHKAAFGDQLATVAIEATGNEYCIASALHLLAPKGRYVQVGMGKENLGLFPMGIVGEKELTIKGCFRYSVGDYETAVGLIASGKVQVKELVTHRFKFEQAIEAYEVVKSGKAIKAIIDGPE
ncbi:unnamed protein product [Kuraishia capsulata CBS 1993]|uniref:Enoyl reductase (ER) domain-containing protein n=1 Tax=Kuraishia capsulata CBS 1993 TaxID=1382522 RepID=W6MHZ7_9ASCO|nr:uncharacterized protein KUCA_T00001438001 [Kuraishia capsulata CBS 1993]CDK25468.1 unnamed protein product [Kuraishia capsulata CBS 1993]